MAQPVDAGSIYSEVRVKLDALSNDIKSINRKFDEFSKKNKKDSDDVEKNWKKAFGKLKIFATASFAAIGLAIKKSISVFAGFEQSLANVQSVARATPKEFQKLEEAARKAGETTRFTASEAADALYSLASAGLTATESADALDGVLQLAGATQSDLAFTSATVTAALSQFGLEAKDSTKISNVFAAAIANSQANMEKLANAFRQVGPVAGALGLTIEDTTGALQALLDAGFQGEQAGAALKNVLAGLASESDITNKKLQSLGLTFEQLDPTVNTTAQIIGNLSEANLSAGEILDAFGTRAGPAMLQLLSAGQKGLEEYTKAVTDTNAAAEAYTIQNDTLAGSQDRLKSALESTTISFIKDLAPALRSILDFLTRVIGALGKLPTGIKAMASSLGIAIPVVGGATLALNALGISMTAALGPIGLVTVAISALVGGLTALEKRRQLRLQEEFGEMSEQLGIAADEIEAIEDSLRALDDVKGLQVVPEFVRQLSTEADYSIKKIIQVGLESEKLSDEYKNQLLLLQSQLEEEDRLLKLKQQNTDAASDQTKTEEEIAEELRRQLEIEEEFAKVESEAAKERDESIRQTDTLVRAGVKTEEQALKDRKSAWEQYANDITGIIEGYADESSPLLQNAANQINALNESIEKLNSSSGIIGLSKTGLAAVDALIEYKNLLEDVGKTERELIELHRTRAITNLYNVDKNFQAELLEAINKYYDELLKQVDIKHFQEVEAAAADYQQKLIELGATEKELVDIQREKAIASINAIEAPIEITDQAIQAINAYYDALKENIEETDDLVENSLEKFLKKNDKLVSGISQSIDIFRTFLSEADSLLSAQAENELSLIESTLDAKLKAIDKELQATLEAAGVAEDTEIQSLQRRLQEAIEEGDAETQKQLEDEILRLQITQEYEEKKTEATEEAQRKSAEIEYKSALNSYNLQIAQAVASAAQAILSIWATWAANPVVAGALSVGSAIATGVQIAAMKESKPQPPSFATGGIVYPSSGGSLSSYTSNPSYNTNRISIPRGSTPRFQTGGLVIPSGGTGRLVNVAENGYPEIMFNGGPSGEAFIDDFAQRMARYVNNSGSSRGRLDLVLQIDGRKVAQSSADYFNNGIVRVKL